MKRLTLWFVVIGCLLTGSIYAEQPKADMASPVPLLEAGKPVNWWFAFKLNAAIFPGCGDAGQRACIFGGDVQDYKGAFSQQYVFASSENPKLQKGGGCLGDTLTDPVGATFNQVYTGSFYYLIWNDQFYGDPKIPGCGSGNCPSPWGHAKGMVAWNDSGEGFVMQVSTPSWPAAGNIAHPRTDGNTLGCVDDNNVKVSQHFFALKLSKDDLVQLLKALQNTSVATDPTNMQIVKNGGPADLQNLVKQLGKKSAGTKRTGVKLSTGVELISKPSALHVPPWQMVSATLGGVPLKAATWWANPKIETTTKDSVISCWDESLGTPGPVQIAMSGQWQDKAFNLKGGPQANANHAKVGVSTDPARPYVIFGDLNQQGALSDNCASSQNGRGGTFYVLKNKQMFESLSEFFKDGTGR